MSRKRGLVLNTFWIISSTVVGFLRSIILIPVLLKFFSLELYNFWVVLISALAVLVYVFNGFQRYSANEYNLQYYVNKGKAIHLLGSGLRLFTLVSAILILLATCFAFSGVAVSNFFGTTVETIYQYKLHYCFVFITIVGLANLLTMYIGTAIEPLGNYYINSRYFALYNVIEVTFWISALFLIQSFFWIFFLYLILILLFNLIFIISLLKKHRVALLVFRNGNIKEGALLFRRSLIFLISNFAEKLSTDGLNFIVTIWYRGVHTLPALQSVRTMSNVFVTGSNSLASTFGFEMQRMTAQEKNAKLVHILQFLWLSIGMLVNLGAILLYPFLMDIYKVWVSNKVAVTEPFFYTIFAMSLIVVYGTIITIYMKVVNEIQKLFVFIVARSVILLTCLFLFPKELFYIAVALYLSEIVFNIFFLNGLLIRIFGKHQELNIYKKIFRSVLPFVLTSLYFMLGYMLPGNVWVNTAIAFAVISSIYLYQLLNEKNFILHELIQTFRNRLPFLKK